MAVFEVQTKHHFETEGLVGEKSDNPDILGKFKDSRFGNLFVSEVLSVISF